MKRIDPNERIIQRSVGFRFRQHLFFNEYPDFKPDDFCREEIDKQISMIDDRFLPKKFKELKITKEISEELGGK